MTRNGLNYKEWLIQARSELKSAEALIKSENYSQAAFHCHQGVEFCIKALYIKINNDFITGHDLVFFGKKLRFPIEILEYCEFLNSAYLDSRYVDRVGKAPVKIYNKNRAELSLKYAKEVIKWIRKKIR